MGNLIKLAFDKLRNEFGNKCQFPDCLISEGLEFVNITPIQIKKIGYQYKDKYYEILLNKGCFMLLCKEHRMNIKGDRIR